MKKLKFIYVFCLIIGACGKAQPTKPPVHTISPPVRVTTSSVDAIEQISAGIDHTCALTESGNVKCWGRNGND